MPGSESQKRCAPYRCLPKYDPNVLDMVVKGKIQIGPFTETRPMSAIAATFDEGHHGKLQKRVVLTPDF